MAPARIFVPVRGEAGFIPNTPAALLNQHFTGLWEALPGKLFNRLRLPVFHDGPKSGLEYEMAHAPKRESGAPKPKRV